MNGVPPLSQADRERIASYFGSTSAPDPGRAAFGEPPSQAPIAPPAAPPPALPDPATTLGVQPPPPPPPDVKKIELSDALKYFAGIAPAPAGLLKPDEFGKTPDPNARLNPAARAQLEATSAKPGPSMADLRAGSANMNAEAQQGAPAASPAPSKDQSKNAAAALAHYGGAPSAAPARPAGGGGSGDFGSGAARKQLYGTFPAEQRAMQHLADAEMAKADAVAAGMGVIGADRIREAALREARAQHEEEIFRSYQEDTQRQLDEVRQKKVDPNRLYQDGGSVFTAIVGGLLGGLYQGVNKLSSNPFIDQMNRNIDKDIALQERELDRNSKSVDARRGILSDMRNVYKDNDLARVQAKNLYYEGVKEQLQAEAMTYDSPAIAARAAQGINAVERQQAALKLDEAAKKAAAAAAAAAFARAEKQREFENQIKQEEAITHRIAAEKSGAGHKEGQSPNERFVATGKHGDSATGYLARSGTDAEKRQTARSAAQTLLGQIDRALEIRSQQGTLGRTLNRNNPDDTIQLYKPEWQTQLRSLSPQMLINLKQSGGLGALDKGVQEIGSQIIGDLESRGDVADVRLKELKRSVEEAVKADEEGAGGQHAVKHPGEQIEMEGGVNAPSNKRGSTGVDREK